MPEPSQNENDPRHSAQRNISRNTRIVALAVFLIALGALITIVRQERGSRILSEEEMTEAARATNREAPQNPVGASGLSNVAVSGVMQAETEVTPESLAENPEKYFGSSVSVKGRITAVMNTNTFILGPMQGGDARILVVGGAVPNTQSGQIVTVKGALLEYDKKSLPRQAGQTDQNQDSFPPGQDKVFAIATTSVIFSKEPTR